MARKITATSIARWLNRETFSVGNTSSDGTTLCLHGNPIARHLHTPEGDVEITTAGWDTTTTKERLNGIPGVQVYHDKKVLHLNGSPWDGKWAVVDTGAYIAAHRIKYRSEKCDPDCAGYFREATHRCIERCDDCARANGYDGEVSDEDIARAITKGLLPEAE